MTKEQFVIQLPDIVDPTLQLPDPTLLQIYENRQNRIMWMLDEVGEESYDWVDFILRCNREDIKIEPSERRPIKCIISNYGGSLENAKMLSEIISLSKTPIYGIVIGMCASAATILYLACHKRLATKNATILLHKGSCNNIEGNFNEVQQFMENYKRDVIQLSEFYKSHTSFPPEMIDDKLDKGDWYIYLQEAMECGIVHEEITDINMLL